MKTSKLPRGKKVFLRSPNSADSAEFTALNKASRKFYRNLVNPPTDEKSFTAFLQRSESETEESFFICRAEDGAIVGAVNLSQIFRKAFQNAYLGYYLAEKYTGCGYMTEAVALVLRYAFKELKLHRIEANVQPENAASIAVLNRCGFTREGFSRKYLKIGGRWRDHLRFAIIAEDWRKRK
jgi:ribosomal-protein-alanine N-acetyltransferase